MKKLSILAGMLTAAAAAALAAEDPIAIRQSLMSSNGSAAAVAGAIMKGEIDYSPIVGKSVISNMHGVADSYGEFFPDGSEDAARSEASPKIWEDAAGFEAELVKFQERTAQALEASGREGPADAAAFQAAIGPVFDSCKTCHESYRIEN